MQLSPVPLGLIICLIVTTLVCIQAKRGRQQPSKQLEHLYQSRNLVPTNRVSGVWSAWSVWSHCSRSCGGGVSTQTRQCISDPVSSNRIDRIRSPVKSSTSATSTCVGQYKRYHFCNKKSCPGKPKDFRGEQCAAFNKKSFMGRYYEWQPFYQGSNSCQLQCRPKGERFYATLSQTVVDGTFCEPGTKDKICVGGICKIVGCDGVIGSDKRWDHCGICGGDNSSCRIVSGLYTMPHLPYGYHLIATIPMGACNINITEMQPSENYLALRHLNGSYILNGDYIISWSGSYEAVGTVFNYQQDTVPYKVEWLLSKGPTMEPIDMMIFSRQSDSAVKYEYTLPLKETTTSWPKLVHTPLYATPTASYNATTGNRPHRGHRGGRNGRHSTKNHTGRPRDHHRRNLNNNVKKQNQSNKAADSLAQDDNPLERIPVQQGVPAGNGTVDAGVFKWHVSGTTDCSQTCGGGIRKSVVVCVKESDLTVVADRHCEQRLRPDSHTARCNTRPCPPEWVTTEWSPCSVSCGEGIQKRDVTCQQVLSSTLQITVAKPMCNDKDKPVSNQKCSHGPCWPTWKTSQWSECSVTCGKGVQRRRVSCIDRQGSVLPDGKCEALDKPTLEEVCDSGPCSLTSKWFFSEWSSQCFAECGQGLQLRRAQCLDGNGAPHDTCDASMKPEVMKSCNSDRSCQGKWFTGPWQPCSSSCGPGFQRREVLCLSPYRGQYQAAVDVMCVESEKPSYEQSCHLKPCAPEWFTTEWGQCSQSCDTGFQVREVKCLDETLQLSHECDTAAMPSVTQNCNTEKCGHEEQGDSGCIDKYSNCLLVVQARMCRYPYYRNICCHSCYKHR